MPFTIDDVADALVRKLGNRVPAVLAGESISLEDQLAQWEERKALEKAAKTRSSCMDDVPTGQPALALAQKVIDRARQAGVPADLIPAWHADCHDLCRYRRRKRACAQWFWSSWTTCAPPRSRWPRRRPDAPDELVTRRPARSARGSGARRGRPRYPTNSPPTNSSRSTTTEMSEKICHFVDLGGSPTQPNSVEPQ